MPELPEVETVKVSLIDEVSGFTVKSTRVHRSDYFKNSQLKSKDIHSASITDVLRHGKQLAIIFSNQRALITHLGMSGRVFIATNENLMHPPKHLHFEMQLSGRHGHKHLFFVDPRRFGYLQFIHLRNLRSKIWKSMGMDALEINHTEFEKLISNRSAAIKSILLNQSVVAGIGNIYADEILFDSFIHPCQAAHTLSTKQVENLCISTKRILKAAAKAGGSTLKDHISAVGKPGKYQNSHKVYGRGGEPCVRCGTQLETVLVQNRRTVFCSHCSPND